MSDPVLPMSADGTRSASDPGRLARLARRHRLLLALVAADVLSKLAAFHLLPHGRPVTLFPGLRLYLAVNEWGVMGGVEGIGAVTGNPGYTVSLAAGLLVFAMVIVQLGFSSMLFLWRLVAGGGVFLAVAFAAQTLAVPFAGVDLPANWLIATIRIAVLAVSVAFYAASRARMPRLAFTLLAAGALSNSASHLYPPFEVVDFVMVPLAPLLRLFGAGPSLSGEADVGVINFADVYLFLFPLVLLAWPLVAMVRRIRATALG